MTPEQASLIEQAERLARPEVWDIDAVESAPDLVAALAAELKRALDENAKLRGRLAKCEPVIEIARALQLTPIWASEIDPIDRLRKCQLPEVTP